MFKKIPAPSSTIVITPAQINAYLINDISHGSSFPHFSRGADKIIANNNIVQLIFSGYPVKCLYITSKKK